MASTTRTTRTFSLEKQVLEEVERTKGPVSTSARVNQLLKTGLEAERSRALHAEASQFFTSEPDKARKARRAFQSASVKSITRD
jgi:hypothetical protein